MNIEQLPANQNNLSVICKLFINFLTKISNYMFSLLLYLAVKLVIITVKMWLFTSFPKSHLNSEWIYEDINFPKYKSKNLKDFALKVFIASFGLLEASQGSYKNFQGKILQIVWFVFWNIDDFINSFWLNLTFKDFELFGHSRPS